MKPTQEHLSYLLRLADNALILGQRNAEWCGHGPVLEEDIALTNLSLDLIGQARMLYQHAAKVETDLTGITKQEDDYAFWRDESAFRNWTLVELPHYGPTAGTTAAERDYAVTIVRNFLYSALMVEVWQALAQSADTELAAIAAKSVKEAHYHLHHARDWLVRFGDGTEESHRRAQAALDYLMPYMNEIFKRDPLEDTVAAAGTGVAMAELKDAWQATVNDALAEATLDAPVGGGFESAGKFGRHSEHMSFLLGEMQGLARQHPGATW
ncbi:1,2-phenylacetyl-CoA epoxidase subunit PaaC [Pandoraea apista]|uniref:1,2-phenylacetyl-CoA epoxidase subunit PaaC n=1 Tax=Pandoraea apista TaxID=93218 RepID=UPI0006599FFC|nr:1,2-phenylacetyl-CoA epoxidase subunit PaaC [Pandoraea apista]ALS66445.1 phenylacetate-CoA oxygenase subunit PaaI [Pandoraea apista]CFB61604.1 1,2-phenylacetyl-CoA epoxidase, subunit C [Pandoraea apista]